MLSQPASLTDSRTSVLVSNTGGMSAASLENMPEEIFSIVFSYLDIRDLASFQRVSRAAYQKASSNTLWHQLLSTFLLPISVSLEEALSLPAPALRQLLSRAYKLECQLRSHRPLCLREATSVHSSSFKRLGDLKACWTIHHNSILMRSYGNNTNELDCLSVKHPYNTQSSTQHQPEEVKLHIPWAKHPNIATSRFQGRDVLVIHSYRDRRSLKSASHYRTSLGEIVVCTIPVTSQVPLMDICSSSHLLCRVIMHADYLGRPQCCEDLEIIGFCFKLRGWDYDEKLRLFLFNYLTGDKIAFSVPERNPKDVILRIFPEHFLFIYTRPNDVYISVYPIPEQIKGRKSSSQPDLDSSQPNSFTIDASTPTEDLPPPTETHRIEPGLVGMAVEDVYMMGSYDGISENLLSIRVGLYNTFECDTYDSESDDASDSSDEYRRKRIKNWIYTISLPPYITASRSGSHMPPTWIPTGGETMSLKLVHIEHGFMPSSIMAFAPKTSRIFWATNDNGLLLETPNPRQNGVGFIRVYSKSTHKPPYGCSNHDSRDRLICELSIPNHAFLDVENGLWYDEHRGRLYLLYTEKDHGDGDDASKRWKLTARVWDIDVDMECN